jgi:hypothetical protein
MRTGGQIDRQTDRQTDRQPEVTQLMVAFCSTAKGPKTNCITGRILSFKPGQDHFYTV